MHKPLDHHFKVVKLILRYLQATIDHRVCFPTASRLSLTCYTDASWGDNPDDRQSKSGFCLFLKGNFVSWGSKKQQVVACSSTKVEYKGLAHSTTKVIWIESLLKELHLQPTRKATLWCDNSSTVVVSTNLILHSKFKHVVLTL